MKDPSKMNPREAEEALARLEAYEKKYSVKAAIVKIQNLQLGSSYNVMPLDDAEEGMKDKQGPEIYLEIFTKDYFHKKLQKDCKGSGSRVSGYDWRAICNYQEKEVECEHRYEDLLLKTDKVPIYFCKNPIWLRDEKGNK